MISHPRSFGSSRSLHRIVEFCHNDQQPSESIPRRSVSSLTSGYGSKARRTYQTNGRITGPCYTSARSFQTPQGIRHETQPIKVRLRGQCEQRGIETNPTQLKAILESPTPNSIKGVQYLTSRLVALGRFISQFTDRLKPFFAILKGANRAGWNEECDQASIAIKQYLVKPPVLASLGAGKTLFVYLSVSDVTVSAALFKENEDGRQRPVFFVSKSLADAETRYNHLEEVVLALRVATKKLCPYFQAHPIVVLTNLSLLSTIHKPDLFGRMVHWAVELSEYGIQYKPRLAKKG